MPPIGLDEMPGRELSDPEDRIILPSATSPLRTIFPFQMLAVPGLRVVTLNSNFCNNFNFWLLLDFDDPSGHLHWLYRTLKRSEQNGEKVILLGHIPPGSKSCYGKGLLDNFFLQ